MKVREHKAWSIQMRFKRSGRLGFVELWRDVDGFLPYWTTKKAARQFLDSMVTQSGHIQYRIVRVSVSVQESTQ